MHCPLLVRHPLATVLLLAGSPIVSAADAVPQVENPAKDRAVPVDVSPPVQPEAGGESVLLPIPDSNPAIGTGLRVIGARFFRADAQSQPSVLGAAAGYYSSDTWFAGIGGSLNLSDNRWRITGGVGYVEANYDFYGIGNDAGDDGIVFPIKQTGTAGVIKVLRRVSPNWYVGLGYRYLDSQVGLRVPVPNAPEIEKLLREGVRLVSSGPSLHASYDTRDLNTNPRSGSYITVDAKFPTRTVFASDENYQQVTLRANHYLPLGEKYTLGGRLTLCSVSDNAPFFDLCLFGASNDLRGYPVGRYQDQTLFAVQTELRAQLWPRWGAVVFAGVGEVAPNFGDMNTDNLLPSAGFGIRWMAAPKNKVNLRADLAFGQRGETAFYLSIGEAF